MRDDPSKGYRTRNVTKQRFYVYAIQVDGVVRYIGKGSNGREHFHAIEARRINSRWARGANTNGTTTNFYRKLAEAMRHGATITEEIMIDGLTDQDANRIEKQKIEELHKQNRGQLWNTIDERLTGITWEKLNKTALLACKWIDEFMVRVKECASKRHTLTSFIS